MEVTILIQVRRRQIIAWPYSAKTLPVAQDVKA